MPRVLPIASITNQPICKSGGSGQNVGSRWGGLCHVRAKIGVENQCFTCNIPSLGIHNKQIGCSPTGVPCGSGTQQPGNT